MRIRAAREIVLAKGFPMKTFTPNLLAKNAGNCQLVHQGIIKENQCCDYMKYDAI